MKDKILFVNSRLSDGGAERVMTLLANEFANHYDVSMILVREKREEIYQLDSRIEKIQLEYGNSGTIRRQLKRVLYVRKYIREIDPNLVISFVEDINVVTLLACIGLNKKIIVSERCNPKSNIGFVGTFVRSFIQKFIYLLADKVIFQTEYAKSCFSLKIQKRSVVIPNPVNPEIPEPYTGMRNKEIVAVGRYEKQKNFPMLIEAFAKFVKEHLDYKLTIYGEGPLRSEYKLLLNELGISEKVNLAGYVSDVNNKMKSAMMYVSSSDYEGISNSMIEALAMGVPTICTDCPVGGARMMINDGKNGLLTPVGDVESLYEAMSKVADDEKLTQVLAENAIKIRENYSIEKIFKMWLGAIKDV